MTNPIPSADLTLNPKATHPPFSWSIGVPHDWAMLDTAPATWQRNAERLIDFKFAGKRLPAKEHRMVFGYLESAVAQTQKADSILCVLQFGRMSTGDLGSTGINAVWHNTGHRTASLEAVHQFVPNAATTSPFDTRLGPGLMCEQQTSVMPPGSGTRIAAQNFQAFVPVAGTSWMLILSGSAAQPEMERVTREAVLAMAHSLAVDDDALPSETSTRTTAATPPTAGEESAATKMTRVDGAGMPGAWRGFGTFIRTAPGAI